MGKIISDEEFKSIPGEPKHLFSDEEFRNLIDNAAEIKKQAQVSEQGKQADEFLKKPWYQQLFTKNVQEELPSATAQVIAGTPVKVATSLADIPTRAVQSVARGGEALAKGKTMGEANEAAMSAYGENGGIKPFKVPLIGKVETFQSEAGKTAGDIVEGKKSLSSALEPFATVPLSVMETAGFVKGAPKVVGEGVEILKDTGKLTKAILGSKNTAGEAMGQILQGETDDVAKGFAALKSLDLKGVNTFEKILTKVKTKIGTVAKEVDDILSTEKGIYKMDDLATEFKSNSGTVVKQNFVEKALNHLSELYEKTEDVAKKANIDELVAKVSQSGLTRKEINDIAREYGSHFKSFNKMGQQLTSVSSEAYENVRKGLKEVARRGITGEVAQAKDKLLSNLYNTQRLIEKNVEAVNKLKQKAEKLGLGRKAIRGVMTAADKVTLGGFRALRETLIQSNVGRKTMNWLDVEEALKKNLKILKKAGYKMENGSFSPKSKTFNMAKEGKLSAGMSIKDVATGKMSSMQEAYDNAIRRAQYLEDQGKNGVAEKYRNNAKSIQEKMYKMRTSK